MILVHIYRSVNHIPSPPLEIIFFLIPRYVNISSSPARFASFPLFFPLLFTVSSFSFLPFHMLPPNASSRYFLPLMDIFHYTVENTIHLFYFIYFTFLGDVFFTKVAFFEIFLFILSTPKLHDICQLKNYCILMHSHLLVYRSFSLFTTVHISLQSLLFKRSILSST